MPKPSELPGWRAGRPEEVRAPRGSTTGRVAAVELLGRWLRLVRTQADAVEVSLTTAVADAAGVGRSTVSQLMNGKQWPRFDSLVLLSSFLNIDVSFDVRRPSKPHADLTGTKSVRRAFYEDKSTETWAAEWSFRKARPDDESMRGPSHLADQESIRSRAMMEVEMEDEREGREEEAELRESNQALARWIAEQRGRGTDVPPQVWQRVVRALGVEVALGWCYLHKDLRE